MTKKEFTQLSEGQYIKHKRYGVSIIDDILIDFGILILPITYNGMILLYYDAKQEEIFKQSPLNAPLVETEEKEVQPYTPSWIKNKAND